MPGPSNTRPMEPYDLVLALVSAPHALNEAQRVGPGCIQQPIGASAQGPSRASPNWAMPELAFKTSTAGSCMPYKPCALAPCTTCNTCRQSSPEFCMQHALVLGLVVHVGKTKGMYWLWCVLHAACTVSPGTGACQVRELVLELVALHRKWSQSSPQAGPSTLIWPAAWVSLTPQLYTKDNTVQSSLYCLQPKISYQHLSRQRKIRFELKF